MSGAYYRVRIADRAKKDIRRIGKKYGKKTYETIRDLILDLECDPQQKGEALGGRLSGLLSRHYSRFRIIYFVDGREFIVVVVGAGYHESESRSDIYRSIERLIESGELVVKDEMSRAKEEHSESRGED